MLSMISVFGLALLDSLSLGTLVIPLMLVISMRRVVWRPLAVYFATVCVSYFLIGAGILLGIGQLGNYVSRSLQSDFGLWIQLIAGVALLLYGVFAPDPKKSPEMQAPQPRNLSSIAVGSLALTAVVLEVATMVPYLAAIAILNDANIANASRLGVLAIYSLVMILPALLCIALIRIVGDRMWSRIERVVRWAEHETKVTFLWIAAIVGVWMVGNAARQLELLA